MHNTTRVPARSTSCCAAGPHGGERWYDASGPSAPARVRRFLEATRQLDVLIWDAQKYSALLEEGELAILSADSVAAIIEVKSTLNGTELRDALALLSPRWWINWRHTSESSRTGLIQQVPDVPFRAVFAFSDEHVGVRGTVCSHWTGTKYSQRSGSLTKSWW